MSKDYYKILGVSKDASQDEIKKAFRARAHEYHPDKQGGNEAKFKEANEAYQVLSNDQKRSQYERFGSTGGNAGMGGNQGFGGFDFSNFDFGSFGGNGGNMEFDLGDIFGEMFGAGRSRRGRHLQLQLTITFEESIKGTHKKIKIPSQSAQASKKEVEVSIPGGVESGQKLKLQGYGEAVNGAHPGDLYLVIIVQPHKIYQKEGYHLVRTLSIKLTDAILGAKYDIETLDKKITVKIPKGVATGSLLRVRGEGVQVNRLQRGDIILKIHIEMPDKLTKEQKKLIEELQGLGL